jgi:pimeloyl-ACP methyl ester carboxylesterase
MAKRASQPQYLDRTLKWPSGYAAWLPERIPPIRRVGYTLVDLMRRSLIPAKVVETFQRETLLADAAWRLLWADTDAKPDAESVADALRSAEGIVLFIHGWAGSGDIWEDLPAMVVQRNPRLVVLIPDVNGFGGTPFSTPVPPIDKCNPPANMRAIELWLDILGIRARPGWPQRRPIILVGHSMGGATLFFLNDKHWKPGEVGRIALAPALLMNDRQRQVFYRTVGTGIRLTGLSDGLDWLVEHFIAPRFIQTVAGSGSAKVRAQHQRVFDSTPEGVIAQTFAAMGQLDAHFSQADWPDFVAFLGEKDLLVGLKPTADLLASMRFQPDQIRQVTGDHYFFSVGGRADAQHIQNRDMLIDEILSMQAAMLGRLNKKPAKKPRASRLK